MELAVVAFLSKSTVAMLLQPERSNVAVYRLGRSVPRLPWFTAEAAAATAALKAALPMVNADTDIVLITDSRSLLDGIVGDPYHMSPDVTSSYSALSDVAEQARSAHVVWVSSHCGIT